MLRRRFIVLATYATGADDPIPDAWGKPIPVYPAVVAQLDRLLPLALVKTTAGRR